MSQHEEDPADFFDLDQDRLEEHWRKQAQRVYTYTQKVADARNRWERCKRKRDVITAECDLAVRRNPAAYGLEKVTEGSVATLVLLQSEVQLAEEKVLAAKHALDLLQAVLDGLEHKKRAMESLTTLLVRNFYAEPQAAPVAQEYMREQEKQRIRRGGQHAP